MMTITLISYAILSLGLYFWLWGTLPILNKGHSIFYKLHTLTVADSVGSLLIVLALFLQAPQYWPLLLVTAISLSLWNTIFSYILGNISDRPS